ncbi:MAG: hypothetical protein F9K48_10440 [Candidatus Brocadia sp.]|nr:MAG: hypothetical protein F9K48_10440 [Candidatus Brocadia sp.]
MEKDDFGLRGTTISDVLTAIQYTLNKIPGYLNPEKRKELRDRIKSYINEAPLPEREIWEDSLLDILIDDKLANPTYKPKSKMGEVRTLLTYNSKISFSTCLRCEFLEDVTSLQDTTAIFPENLSLRSITLVNQFIQSKRINNIALPIITHIKYRLEEGMSKMVSGCNIHNTGLPAALCYYAMLMKQPIPGNIAVTGGLDEEGRSIPSNALDGKIEVVLRELHFIDEIIIAKGSSIGIFIPNHVRIIEVANFEQALNIVLNRNIFAQREDV